MLLELYIKNYALIEEECVKFGENLNIITGETGSGKSIVLDALSLALGSRFDKMSVRKGSDKGVIEAIFFIEEGPKRDMIAEMGIDVEEDGNVIITRELYADGKSVSRLNGRNVRLSFLKELSSLLIDIHGQHEYHGILNKDNHIKFLDSYGEEGLKDAKVIYEEAYKRYRQLNERLEELTSNMDEMELQREIDLLNFQIEEIKNAQISTPEYDELIRQRDVFRNFQNIYESLNNAYSHFYGGGSNAFYLISKGKKSIQSVLGIDEELDKINSQLEDVYYGLDEVSKSISSYLSNIEFDQQRLDEIEFRLSEIGNLKRKYGNEIEEILEYQKSKEERLDEILNLDSIIGKITAQKDEMSIELAEKSGELTRVRKEIASDFEEKIKKELKELNVKGIEFMVSFESVNVFSKNGNDKVEFMASFNKGEDLKPLAKIASGGEMSRFILAFKKIVSELEDISTMVFDEIDAGISGRTAQIVGEKIKEMSVKRQIICITHLPQIAVLSDTHFYIEKHEENDRTFTRIRKIDGESKVGEIARLMSGFNITNKTLENAREIIDIVKK